VNTSALLEKAARNNMEWCDAVALAHNVKTEQLDNIWFTLEPMPPFYPNLITTAAEAYEPSLIHDLMRRFPESWSMKDGFNSFENDRDPFNRLFSAYWYGYASPKAPNNVKDFLKYQSVTDELELERWISAWGETPEGKTIFNANFLTNQDVTFIYFSERKSISCGAILYDDGDVIGVSNLFGSKEEQQRLIRTVQLVHPMRDIVGYGNEAEVTLLKPFGFQELGKLNILKSTT
jgi:hypothetical protein